MKGVPTNYLVLVARSYQPQLPCLQVIVLGKDTRENEPSAVDADPLREKRLLYTFFISARLLPGIGIGYLACQLRILNFLAGFPAWDIRALMCSPCADQPLLRFWRNLVSTGTAFTRGITIARYARSSELYLFDIRATTPT